MMGYAHAHVAGNVGQNPELRYTPNGTAVCNFSVAVNLRRGEQETVNWYRVTLFGATAENADKYITKGMPVLVSGALKLTYFTRNDGGQGHSLEIVGGDFRMLGSREDAGGGSAPADDEDDFEDVPF